MALGRSGPRETEGKASRRNISRSKERIVISKY